MVAFVTNKLWVLYCSRPGRTGAMALACNGCYVQSDLLEGCHSSYVPSFFYRSKQGIKIFRFIIIPFFSLLCAGSVFAQTVELSSRTFWLGEVPNTMESDPPFFAPQRIQWLNEIIENDPILRETVFHVDMVPQSIPVSDTIPVSERIVNPGLSYVLLSREQVPNHLYLEGFQIFGPSSGSLSRIRYLPSDPSSGFHVTCSQMDDMQSLRLCVVRATYPPDDLIWLKSRLYFPDNPADRPDFFRQVAERMREFTYCLDVTNSPVNPQEENPTLTGCRWEITS